MKVHKADDSKTNLCDSCMLHPAECGAIKEWLEYGDAPGNDNVIACDAYHDSFLVIREKPEK